MMNTPICDFVTAYVKKNSLRLHMPGHKGITHLGCEPFDITEIVGADSLYDADGIIRESERNAGMLFGCRTFYSTEGSSHAIRAMLALTCQSARKNGKTPLIWAGRNAHSTFLSAVALLDISVQWLCPADSTYLSCPITADTLEKKFQTANELPVAVYLTSPDYLGNQVDIAASAKICHRYGVLLLVDHAHGAYLKFLPDSRHPIDLGADLCCASAHKTLPVLTGGAYLHVSPRRTEYSDNEVKEALRLFGSTSPSYLILQSLDMANRYLAADYRAELEAFLPRCAAMKQTLAAHGYTLIGSEPFKLTIAARNYGYTGMEIAECLAKQNVAAEFFDPDYIVLMLTPSLTKEDILKLTETLLTIPRRKRLEQQMPPFSLPRVNMTVRAAMLSPFEVLPVALCLGRTLARASVSCPPAVPILVSGEIIDETAIQCFRYYGIETCKVTMQPS